MVCFAINMIQGILRFYALHKHKFNNYIKFDDKYTYTKNFTLAPIGCLYYLHFWLLYYLLYSLPG